MERVEILHTSRLTPADRVAVRALCDAAFEGDFSDADMAHGMGGLHALVRVDGRILGHGSVVRRAMTHEGEAVVIGYVENVAVDPGLQRRGIGRALMGALDPFVTGGHDAGALSASDAGRGLYAALGWEPWWGSAAVMDPHDGLSPTEGEEAALMVRDPAGRLEPHGLLACDWRDGDVW